MSRRPCGWTLGFLAGPNSFTDTLPIGKIIAVDLDSGLTINTWDAETNSDRGLDALAVIPGEAIIIGGAFTQSGGQALNGLARFNLISASTLPAPQPALDVLLVVADPAGLQAGETEIKDRLETQGATVTVADDNTVTVADADSSDVVLVSQCVSSSAVNTKLNDTTTGLVVWKPSLYDDLGLTASAGGTLAAQTQLDVVDDAHPIADGLSGTVTVYDSSKKTTFGTPTATATVVANTAGGSDPVIFTYDTDDTLASGASAAGRRVGFYFDTNAATVTTDNGWTLFDNTITWAGDGPPPISQRSTVSLGGVSVATVSEGEVTWLVADNLGSPTVTYRAVGNTPASVALYYPYGQPRTAQIEGTGTGFTGQVSDLESGTGLAFYNARYYDPTLGRFTQPDTIIPNASNGQDFNRYSYVRNNPVNYTDASGRCPQWVRGSGFSECTTDAPGLEKQLAAQRLAELRGTAIDVTVVAGELNYYSNPGLGVDAPCTLNGPWPICVEQLLAESLIESGLASGQLVDYGGSICPAGIRDGFCGSFVAVANSQVVLGVPNPADLNAQMESFDASVGATAIVATTWRRFRSLLCSFAADTEVLMADGTTKPISEIQIGDWVLAEDPETGERGSRQVTALWVHPDTLVDLNIGGADVTTTEDHPFWNATDNQWQRADLLDTGDYVLAADGDLLEVDGIDWTSTTTGTAYNLTISNINTYYVAIGDDTVLVHNTCDGISGRAGEFDLDELAQLAYQHVGAGDIAGRPTLNQISNALATDGVRLADQNAVRFTLGDVVVIINENLPTRSTAFFRSG